MLALLTASPGVAAARTLSDEELGDLLRPWLGSGAERLAVPLPAVIAVRLTDPDPALDRLARRLDEAAPGTLLESHGVWIRRLAVLARSLQACAGLALLLVAAVAAAVIAVATRAGLVGAARGDRDRARSRRDRRIHRRTLCRACDVAGGAPAGLPARCSPGRYC